MEANVAAAGEAPLEATWTDPKRYLWLLGLIVPLVPFIAFGLVELTGLGIMWWAGPFVVFALIPFLDQIVGKDSSNPPDSAIKWLEPSGKGAGPRLAEQQHQRVLVERALALRCASDARPRSATRPAGSRAPTAAPLSNLSLVSLSDSSRVASACAGHVEQLVVGQQVQVGVDHRRRSARSAPPCAPPRSRGTAPAPRR